MKLNRIKALGIGISFVGSVVGIIPLFQPKPEAKIVKDVINNTIHVTPRPDLEIRDIDLDIVIDDVQKGPFTVEGSFVFIKIVISNKTDAQINQCILYHELNFDGGPKFYNRTPVIPSLNYDKFANFNNIKYRAIPFYLSESNYPKENYYFNVPANKDTLLELHSSNIFSKPEKIRFRIESSDRVSDWYYMSSNDIPFTKELLSFEEDGFYYNLSRVGLAIWELFE